jgi:molecular chaperone GrpE
MMSQDKTENPGVENQGPGPGNAGDESAGLQAELEQAKEESRALQDKYLRLAADMENYRRRAEREKSELLKFAAENLIKDLLPALDSFNQAIGAGAGGGSGMVEGVQLVQQQLLAAMRKHGLEEVPAVGEKFDPNVHQAIQRIEDPDCSVETVAQEFAKGYMLNGRLVRAAMVSVTVPSK